MVAKKKSVGRKKATKKIATKQTATKQTASKTAPKKTASKTAAKAPVKKPSASLEERMAGRLEEFEKLVGQLRRRPPRSWEWPRLPEMPSLFESRFPNMDIVNREKEITVRAEVPGIDKDDIDISLSGRTLTIKGESRHEEEKEEGDIHRHEIRRGSFSRVVTLPEEVNGARATSSYKDGMVELTLPKSRQAKKHSIKIG
ncbi:MAG: Hsp20/alpha crystallin family protein [Gammaproteobacteria bacterium]|nr:Hsp20/alpha crystallin family protein [Gammaproteobacteria bacterium]NND37907.1 Hsp20 family protein [Gammaproteobacteria bacterium]